jgi:hypothetical protein
MFLKQKKANKIARRNKQRLIAQELLMAEDALVAAAGGVVVTHWENFK